jgi:hypothetical protein
MENILAREYIQKSIDTLIRNSFIPGNRSRNLFLTVLFLSFTFIGSTSETSGVFIAERMDPTYFSVGYGGNGIAHMNINIEELSETNFHVGDEIAAFDGGICVGAVKLSESDFVNNVISIPASASTQNGSIGFTEGNPIELRAWHINKSADSQPQSELVEGELIYQKHASVFVRMTDQQTTGINEFASTKIEMFPNPGIDKVNLRYSKMPKMGTRIILTDITGKQLINREVQSMLEVLDIQSYPTGMYFVRTTIGDEYKVHKLIKS